MNFNRLTSIILVSDVHLGDPHCRYDDFYKFLEDISEAVWDGILPSFKVLIILGDFIDFIWRSSEKIFKNKNFNRINEKLQNLKEMGIEIINILGNHEISTWGTYNLVFKERKIDFLKKIEENGFNYNYMNENSVFQYGLLTKTQDNNLALTLSNSIHLLKLNYSGMLKKNENNREIFIRQITNPKTPSIFMAHGYQFYNKFLHHMILAPTWKSYLEDNQDRKELNKFLFKTKTFLKKLSGKDESIGRNVKNDAYANYIVKYLYENNLTAITHVIFGHSHMRAEIAKEKLEIINSGCWLSDKTPSYLEILNDGTPLLKEIS